jgi:hypothetical protein
MGDEGVPYDAGTVPPSHQGCWLNFDGAELTVHAPDGQVTHRFDAVSGTPGSSASDQPKAWIGPIPEGTYSFASSDLRASDPAGVRAFFQDWGNYHVPVSPTFGTNTFGRSGFHIHGGLSRGSAGCIDVGPNTHALHDALKDIEGTIFVTVHYDNPNAFNWMPGDIAWLIPAGIPQWEDWRRPAPAAEDTPTEIDPWQEAAPDFDMESDAASRGLDMEADTAAAAWAHDMRSDMPTEIDPWQEAAPDFDVDSDAASRSFDIEADAAEGTHDMRSDMEAEAEQGAAPASLSPPPQPVESPQAVPPEHAVDVDGSAADAGG